MKSHTLGQSGESFAAEFLKKSGYEILDTNYRKQIGEIDIVAKDRGVIVFVEVKTRVEDGWDAFEAVSPRKQKTMAKVAQMYLIEKFGSVDIAARFDVLAIRAQEDGSLTPDLLKDAFFLS